MTSTQSAAQLIEFLTSIERDLSLLSTPEEVLRSVTRLAVERVGGAEYAGITQGRNGRFTSVAVTDDVVEQVDQIQYELVAGPCVDAILEATVFCADDLRTDDRWPLFGKRAAESTGVLSMLAFRLYLENDPGQIAGLNMYSTTPMAFDEASEMTGMVLATAGAMAVTGALARERANNLEVALRSSREIGIAIGVLMAAHKTTRERGFDMLRIVSQATHRKLADIASEVADTGALPDLPPSRSRPGGRGQRPT
jgi:ANTAR domain/GAF domain